MENCTLKNLKMNLNNPALDAEKQGQQLTLLVDYFYGNRGRHRLYGLQYFYVVIFNAIHVFLDIVITHYVLNRNFLTYGWDFTFSSKANRMRIQDQVFPKMAKCNLHLYGPSGTRQLFDGICLLPMNILNDKIFLILWLWYFALLTLSIMAVFYTAFHILSPKYRLSHIERHLKGKLKGNQLKFLNKNFGDWFLLHQLYKNIHLTNFVQLVSKLCAIEENGDYSKHLLRRNETYVSFSLPDDADDDAKESRRTSVIKSAMCASEL
jgi:hypothetical protein